MSSAGNASRGVPSWELNLAKILGVSPEALLAARGGGLSGGEEASSSSPSAAQSISSPSPSAPASPPPLVLYDVTSVTDRQIVNGLYTSSVLGFLCVLGFILLRPHVRFYEARRYIRGVSVRPPPLSHRGALARAASWLVPVFSVPDAELVRSAGLDALMVHRTLSFGLLFFSPLAVVGCAVLLPLYATAGGSTTSSSSSPSSSAASSARVQKLAQLALGNLPPGSRAQLVPFFFCVAALVYGCWLLDVFLKEFVLLRQMYLSTGEAAGALAAAAAAVRSEARKGSRGGPANEAAAAAAESSSSAAPNDAAEEGGGLLTWEAIAAAVAPDPGVIRIGDGQPAPRVAPPAPPSSPPPRLCSPGLLLPSHIPVPLRKTLPIVFPGHPRSRLVAVGADLFAALAFDVPPPPPRVKKAARQEAKATAAAAAAAAAATAATAEPAAAGRTKSSAGSWRRGWMLAGFGGASEENAAGGGSDSDSDGDSDGDGIESAVGGVSDDSGDDESSAPRNSSSGRRLCCCSRSVDALGAVAALCAGPLTAPAASGFDGDGDLAISAALQQQVHEAVSEEAALLLAASTSPGARGDGARGGARGAGSVSTSTSEADSSKRQQQQQQQRQRQQQSDVAALGSAAATAARAAFSLRHRRRRRKWGNSNGSSRRYSEGDGGERGEEGEGTTEDGAVAVVVQAPPPPPPPPAKTTTTATTTTTTTAAAAPSLARRRRTPLPCPDAAPEAWFAAASRLGGQDLVDAVFSRVAGGRAWGGDGFGVVVVGGAAAAGGASKGFYLGSVPVRDHRKAHAALEALEKARARLRKAETEAAEVKREQEEEEEEEEEEKDDDEEQKRRSSPSSASSRRAAKRLAAASDAVDAATEQLREAERAVEEAQREALREEERGDEGAAQDGGSDRKAPRERPPHPSAFIALFSTPAAASAVASVPLFPQGWRRSFRVARAPGADEVCWQALWTSPARRRRGRALAFCWLAFFVGLPVGIFAGALANLEHAACSAQDAAAAAAALASSGGGGEPSAAPQQAAGGLRGLFCGRSSFARSLVTGTLPPVLVALWSCLVMPKALLRGVLLASSDRSLSAVDARVCRLFFAWTFFNVIVGAVLGGSALLLVPSLLRDPASVYRAVGGSLSNASNFFVNYLETQALLMAPFRLLWPCSVPLKVVLGKIGRGWRSLVAGVASLPRRAFRLLRLRRLRRRRRKKKEERSTTRAADEAGLSQQQQQQQQQLEQQQQLQRRKLEPEDLLEDVPRVSLRAGREVGGTFFQVAAVALAYGAVAPLALPFAALWCLLSWIVWRLQILYVFERSHEGGGALFFTAAGGIAAALGAHAFFTGCVLAANGAVAMGGALAVGGPLGMWLFHRRCGRRYGGMAAAGAPALLTASVGSVAVAAAAAGSRRSVEATASLAANGSSSPPAPPKQEDLCFYAPTPPKALRDMWTPPALRRNARGWQSGEGAVWQGWRAPAFFPGA